MSPGPNERLDSWKEIAAYLKKGIRTVQRWERTEGLPVRRLGQDRTGVVFAYKAELDAWWQHQSNRLTPRIDPEVAVAPNKTRARRSVPAILLTMSLTAAAAVLWNIWPSSPVVYRPIPLTTEHGWEYDPSFSPDGRRIAYAWIPKEGQPAIYVRTIGAESGTRLTSSDQVEVRPAWSPDGRFIALLRSNRPEPGFAVIVVPIAGGPENRIARLNSSGVLTWSRDGQWLVGADGSPKSQSLVALAVASGVKHVLTNAYEFGFQGVALSSDSRWLVFSPAGPGAKDLYEQALGPNLKPQGDPRRIKAKLQFDELQVNPDANEVIYTDSTLDGCSLWRLSMSGTGAKPRFIHATSDRCFTPAISPDGRRLAFAVDRGYREDTWRLSLADLDSASPILSSTHSDLNPQYSPDGRHIAFHSTRAGASDIWIVDSDGTNPRRLTFTNARTTATPRWSPDGEWIAFESNQTGQTEIYAVRSAGGQVRRLTDNPATDAIPSWSRDGRKLYFCSNRTGRFEIWKMPSSGGLPTQVTFNGGFAAVESPDAKYLYYSQTRNSGPVMKVSLAGGAAEQIIPEIRGLFFAATARGIYFHSNRTISFWDAASGGIHEVFTAAKPIGIGMDVSPDEHSLLFTQVHTDGADLYMIDGLR